MKYENIVWNASEQEIIKEGHTISQMDEGVRHRHGRAHDRMKHSSKMNDLN